MIQNLIDIFAAPGQVFPRLLTKPTVLLPLLLVVLAVSSIQVGYIVTSDRNFLIDQLVDQALATSASVRESEIRPVYENLNPAVLIGSAAVSTAVFLCVISLLTAMYLNFVSKFGFEGRTYKQWFSLVCWTSMPTLLIALAAWVTMAIGNGQVSLTALQPLSLDYLLNLNSGKQLLQNLSLPGFWSMGLLVLGYQHFTGSRLGKAALITLLPYVLLYGIWAYFSFS